MRSRFPLVVVTVAFLAALSPMTSAQSLADVNPQKSSPNKKALIGSWLETVTFPPEVGFPQVKSVATFHGDETMVASDQGGVTTEPPTVYSAGHGVWKHLKQRSFAYTVLYLLSDLSGNLTGYLKVRGVFNVSESGNEYDGTSFAQVLDADGNVLFSVEVTNTAQRIQIELP